VDPHCSQGVAGAGSWARHPAVCQRPRRVLLPARVSRVGLRIGARMRPSNEALPAMRQGRRLAREAGARTIRAALCRAPSRIRLCGRRDHSGELFVKRCSARQPQALLVLHFRESASITVRIGRFLRTVPLPLNRHPGDAKAKGMQHQMSFGALPNNCHRF
jgi:hypothetical protein